MIDLFLKKIFGSKNERELKRLAPLVDRINALEPQYRALSDAQLRAQTAHFRERLDQDEPLEELLPIVWADCVNCVKFPDCDEIPMLLELEK